MLELRSHLSTKGFTVAPDSEKLIAAVQAMSREELNSLVKATMLPALYSADVIHQSLAQLRGTLPTQYSVLGPFKARYRNAPDSAAMLHKDTIQVTQHDVRNCLFPMPDATSELSCAYKKRYQVWKDELSVKHSGLKLPVPPSSSGLVSNDLSDLTAEIITAIRDFNSAQAHPGDELVFEVVNVWIPRDVKRLIFFPLDVSIGIDYPLRDVDISKVQAAEKSLQSFSSGSALFFFGQSILHQAFMPPGSELADGVSEQTMRNLETTQGDGSLEGRYLLVVQRAKSHAGSLPLAIPGLEPLDPRPMGSGDALPASLGSAHPLPMLCSALADDEVAAQIEGEIIRHGGMMNCNLVYQANPKLRKLVGDRKMLEFMRKYPALFLLEKTERGTDFVRTARTVQSEGVTSGDTLPAAATMLGRRAINELEHAVIRMLFKWKDGKFGHDSPFFRQVMRDHHVRLKLQSFIKFCPLRSLMLHKGLDAEAEGGETWWVAQNLHLKAFLQDRPNVFTVFDSQEDCAKGWDQCCCHLKIQLEEGVALPPPAETKAAKGKKALKSKKVRQLAEGQADSERPVDKSERKEPPRQAAPKEDVALTIVAQNEDLIVVDKPPHVSAETVFAQLQREADAEGAGRPVLSVSKETLQDTDASGCLVVPHDEASANFLATEFSEHKVTKVYRALVRGHLPPEGQISAKLFLAEKHSKHRAFVSPKGKPCVTSFKTLAVYQRKPHELPTQNDCQSDPEVYFSYVECYPTVGRATCAKTVTGATHQIRAHFQHIGLQLVGDSKYGTRDLGDLDWCPRLFLHCCSVSGLRLSGSYHAEAPLPSDLEPVLMGLDELAQSQEASRGPQPADPPA